MKTILYATYGGLLDHKEIRKKCPTAQPIAKGWLYDYRLTIQRVLSATGGRDVVTSAPIRAHGHSVPVVIWEVGQEDYYRWGYEQCNVNHHPLLRGEIIEVNGERRCVMLRFPCIGKYAPPTKRLLKSMVKDYVHFNFPLDVLTDAVKYTMTRMQKLEAGA